MWDGGGAVIFGLGSVIPDRNGLSIRANSHWGAPLLQATARFPGGDPGHATYLLDDADEANGDFGVGDGGQSLPLGNKKDR